MALRKQTKAGDQSGVLFIEYIPKVPFNKLCTITEHTVITADVITPDTKNAPIAGNGAIYRLIGNGTATPTFTGFNKSSGSGNYDPTAGVVNLVTFLYDGVDYWYNIVQPVV